jgi:UDP-glucose:(heptosyl)LPS alpha-1,3-glucosyltransferase
MRLGLVRQRYTPFGGAERFVERAIAALAARGVRISV